LSICGQTTRRATRSHDRVVRLLGVTVGRQAYNHVAEIAGHIDGKIVFSRRGSVDAMLSLQSLSPRSYAAVYCHRTSTVGMLTRRTIALQQRIEYAGDPR
jgi:hypothetical protein